MKLEDAAKLLDYSAKYFSEVYKHYEYRDDGSLKDYLEFVIHEPAEWLMNLPSRYKSLNTFGQPKTAIIKLTKISAVIDDIGTEFASKVHDTLWSTFKTRSAEIYTARNKFTPANMKINKNENTSEENTILSEGEALSESELHPHLAIAEESVCGESVHSFKIRRGGVTDGVNWEARYKTLNTAMRQMLADYKETAPGFVAGFTTLLDALDHF